VVWWEARSAGSLALALSLYRDLVRSSLPARLWERWREPVWAAAVGGVAGALIGMGMPEYEAKRYEGRVKEGGILLSVHCDSSEWVKRAKEILKQTGAEDVSSTGEASADYDKTDKPRTRTGQGYET